MNRTGRLTGLAIRLAGLLASTTFGGNLYWDVSTGAGYQHGDGLWSDNRWTANGTVLEGWSDGNIPKFNATAAGSSTILLDGSGVSCSGLTVEGDNYTLIVTNGGTLTSTNLNFIWGFGSSTPTNNILSVIGGAGVTSRVSHAGTFWVGYSGNGNTLIIDGLGVDNSAVVSNSGAFLLGYTHVSSQQDSIILRRGGRLVVTDGNIIVGRSGDYHKMTIEDGGLISGSPLYLGNAGGHSNTLTITGSNTVVDQVAILYVANDSNLTGNWLDIANGATVTNVAFRIGNNGCSGNALSVTNGGRLFTSASVVNIGYLGAASNTALVSGADSMWDAGGNAVEVGDVGQAASSNVLIVADGGRVQNVSQFTVVSNNSLHLLGGTISAATVTLNADSETVVGINAESGPGVGWGQLATTGASHALGGTLKPVLKTGFKPAGSVTFTIMTNSSGSITGTFANAGDGDTIAAYAEDLVTEIGAFTVGITADVVTLTYVPPPAKGAIILVR